jgi:NADH:ubiquinone oxidoreductase subunit E
VESESVFYGSPGGRADDELSSDQWSLVNSIINKHHTQMGSLIPVLEEIQENIGYIPKAVQARVAEGLGVPLSEVYGVVTFYHFFTMIPRGRHTVRCCLGTACYVRGGRKNMAALENNLGIAPGETTEDRRFSLETVRCLGACGLAPVITVGDDAFRQVKPSEIDSILKDYE